MNHPNCSYEHDVLDAVRSGSFSDELRVHAMECPECTELVLVAGIMNRGAARLGDIGPLPDAGYVWWRANLEQREKQSRRATGIITLVQRVALVAGGVLTFVLLRNLLPELAQWGESLKSSAEVLSIPISMTSPSLVILVCLGLLAAPKVFDLYGGWVGD